jgi:catechol 2,3-dioxygenase-like lactoylglutathione lyase family enzyme
MITKLAFVAVPSRDAERSPAFYADALGLRADASAHFEFWVGETCFGIWEPEGWAIRAPRRGKRPPPPSTWTASRASALSTVLLQPYRRGRTGLASEHRQHSRSPPLS